MAQIQINVDTEAKTVALTINGTTVPDVEDVSVYSHRDSNGNVTGLDVSMYTVSKTVDGVTKRVTYYASGSEKAQSAIASNKTVYNDVKGFVGVEDGAQAAKDIDEFLSSKRRNF
jgi:hypothetical protein